MVRCVPSRHLLGQEEEHEQQQAGSPQLALLAVGQGQQARLFARPHEVQLHALQRWLDPARVSAPQVALARIHVDREILEEGRARLLVSRALEKAGIQYISVRTHRTSRPINPAD